MVCNYPRLLLHYYSLPQSARFLQEDGMKREINVERYAWVILVLMCLGISLPDYAQYQVPAFGPMIQETMKLVPTQFSTIATAPLLPGIFLSLIAGLLVDRFGVRRILVGTMIITAAGVILRVFANGFWSMYLTMICMGVAATFLNSNVGKILGQWFSPKRMALSMGIFLASANASMSLGTGTAGLYPNMRAAFIGSAVLAVIILALWIVLMRDRPAEKTADGETIAEEKVSILRGLKIAATSRTVWMCAVCLFLSVGGMTSMANFMPSALNERGFSESVCNVVSMAVTLGGLGGCLIAPVTARWFPNKRMFFITNGILAGLGVLFAWRISDSPAVTFVLLFLTGYFCTGSSPILMSMPVRDPRIGTRYGGTAGGFVATIQLGGSVVIPSYILAPIATRTDGSCNFALYFGLIALMMAVFVIVCNLVPGVGQKSEG